MLGEKPATDMEPNWEEGDWGREEGEGEQETVWLSKCTFSWMRRGGDQENLTSLSPGTAENISGGAVGHVLSYCS